MRDEKGRFVAGYSGNPKGRPSLPEYVEDIRGAAIQEFTRVVEILCMPQLEAVKILNDESESLIVAMTRDAVKKNDRKYLCYVLDRFLPKPQEKPMDDNIKNSEIVFIEESEERDNPLEGPSEVPKEPS